MNHSYLRQFLHRRAPAVLPEHVRRTIAPLLSVHESRLRQNPADPDGPPPPLEPEASAPGQAALPPVLAAFPPPRGVPNSDFKMITWAFARLVDQPYFVRLHTMA